MKRLNVLNIVICCLMLTACTKTSQKMPENKQQKPASWQSILTEKLPLFGHRNWIVVADMAYPMQTKAGIITLYADEPYEKVLAFVMDALKKTPHVQPVVYQDEELAYVQEGLCPGINAFRRETAKVLSDVKITPLKHEALIAKLDSISSVFQVIIIKTNLTKPYTSTFVELDCKYWNGDKQKMLEKAINEKK